MAYNAGSSTGNLILIQKQVASNSASLAFTTGVSGYDNYFLSFYGVIMQTDAQNLNLQLSSNGGSTYFTTNYQQYGFSCNSAGIFELALTANAGWALATSISNTASNPLSGSMTIYNLNSVSVNPNMVFQSSYWQATVASSAEGGGGHSTNGTSNAFKIIPDSGNIVSGTFKLYGVQN
jgi:hypothetical protein